MKAVIMAGGEGQRLRPLTCDIPKPMARLLGKPVICYILDLLSRHNITDAAVSTGYLANDIKDYFYSGIYKNIKITFANEPEPLGTAGGVKNAASALHLDFGELLVISGDALTDFDLTAALNRHREKNADATVIVKAVTDPREYGLVNYSENGEVTGFCEKPGWNLAAAGSANTGIYILNKNILDMIPLHEKYDFANDLFPLMLKNRMRLCVYEDNGYWCDIGDLKSYLVCQKDILMGKVSLEIPQCMSVPDSGAKTEHPCFISEGVKLHKDCLIAAYSVIGNGAKIGADSKINGSVIGKNVIIGSGVHLTNAIVCDGAVIKNGSHIFEDAVIGSKACIGENVQIMPDIKIWPKKKIADNVIVSENVVYGSIENSIFGDEGIIGEVGIDITPELCVRLGSALGSLKYGSRIGVANMSGRAAKAFKTALIAGILGTGSQVWDFGEILSNGMSFAASFCSLPLSVYISAGSVCKIKISGEGGLPLTRSVERELEGIFAKHSFKRASAGDYRDITDMSGTRLLYLQELYRTAPKGLNGTNAAPVSVNPETEQLFFDILCKLDCNTNSDIQYVINDDGSELSIITEDKIIPWEKIKLLCAITEFEQGKDVSVPYHTPKMLDSLSQKYGRTVLRFLSCPNDKLDDKAREMARHELWLFDGMAAAVKLLSFMKNNNLTLEELFQKLPVFSVVYKEIEIDESPLEKLSAIRNASQDGLRNASQDGLRNASQDGLSDMTEIKEAEGIRISREHGSLYIRPTKKGNAIKIFAEALTEEIAEEMCFEIERKLK